MGFERIDDLLNGVTADLSLHGIAPRSSAATASSTKAPLATPDPTPCSATHP